MRRAKFIATKDHFFMYATTDEINDELIYIDNNALKFSNNQSVTFFSSGSSRMFIENDNDIMEKRTDCDAPVMLSYQPRTPSRKAGIVNIINSKSSFGQIIVKEIYDNSLYTKINNAKDTEKELIENNFNQTIVISDQCKVAAKRTLDTFDFFEPEVTNNVTEEELNIDWGE